VLVTEARRRSNPRVLYGILAESVLEQLAEKTMPEAERRAYLQNLVRLLEMYRYNTLRRTSPRAVLDRRQTDIESLKRDRAENQAVESAIFTAHQQVYAHLDKHQLVEHLKALFGRLSRNELGAISPEEMLNVKRFLEALMQALRS
jgi:hypothetical protein